jgi:hypothetical protein
MAAADRMTATDAIFWLLDTVPELRFDRRSEPFRAVEVVDAQKLPILRSYRERWRFAVNRFQDIGSVPSDDDLLRIALRYLVTEGAKTLRERPRSGIR